MQECAVNTTDFHGERLSNEELREMFTMLARYAEHDLDQWELWRLETSHGSVFMHMTRKTPPAPYADAFHTVWPLPRSLRSQ